MKSDKTIIITVVLFIAGIGISLAVDKLTKQPTSLDGDVQNRSGIRTSVIAQRVVCLTPLGTETIYALAAEDKLVGISDFCDYPPETKNMRRVGGAIDTGFETITSLRPDLIIVLGRNAKVAEFCKNKGIKLLRIRMSDMDSLYNDVIRLGDVLGCPGRSRDLCRKMFDELLVIKSAVSQAVEADGRPGVFLSLHRKPGSMSGLSTAGDKTCLTDLIEIAGGKNIFHDLEKPYSQISKESLLKRNPDMVIESCPYENISADQKEKLLTEWQQFPTLPAVKNNRIYFTHTDFIMRPGPRVGKIARTLAGMIHPEAFDE